MTTQIGRIVLLTRDPDATAAFYRDAFGFTALYDATTQDVRFLHVGPGGLRDAGLWLMPIGADDAAAGARAADGPSLVLYVDDLAATLERLAQLGVEPASAPVVDPESAQVYAEVTDPDGHGLILVELVAFEDPAETVPAGGSTATPGDEPAAAEPLREPTADEIATIPDLS